MVITKCIETESLLLYLQGMLGKEYSEEIERHLLECSQCENLIVDLKTSHESLGMFGASTEVVLADGLDSADHLNIRHLEEQAKKITATPYLSLQEKSLGNYLLHKPVGRGGMAVVYKAENKKLGKIVAVKILRSGLHGPSIHRIEREIKAHSKLNHHAIVSAIDAGEEGTIQYLVTEFVDGLDLNRIVKSYGKLPIADACEILRQSAFGIGSAHEIGIIHRDIKPSNIMIDVTGQVKVLDFGLVHFQGWSSMNLELTSVGQLLGTLDYMPPEQAEDPTSVDLKSDIYSLGATLFCLLVGRAPFVNSSHQSPLEKLRLIANEKPPQISTLRSDVPKELSHLVDLCLSRSPSDRPESTAQLADQLEPFCRGHRLDSLIAAAKERALEVETKSFSHRVPSNVMYLSANSTVSMTNQTDSLWGRRNFWKNMFLGLSSISALFLLGFFIIQTNRGQVIVEVPDENVKVEVVSAGKVYQELELKPGTNSVHLFAGNYQIRIKKRPEFYHISGDSIILGRGKTVLAKITRIPKPSESGQGNRSSKVITVSSSGGNPIFLAGNRKKQDRTHDGGLKDGVSKDLENKDSKNKEAGTNRPANSIASPVTPLSENTVDGKNIKHWLSVLVHEQNAKLVDKAIYAIRDLSDLENDHLVRAAITKVLVQGKDKLNLIATEKLFIHHPFSSGQLKEMDTAIEKMNPDMGVGVLEIKVKLVADQLLTDFDKDRYLDVYAKTMKQISHFLDRSSKGKSDVTSLSPYDVQLQIINQQLIRPFLNQKKWANRDESFRRLTDLSCSSLRSADLVLRSIENHPEKHFVMDENFDNLQSENQTPIVVQNIDGLMTTGLAKMLDGNLNLPEELRLLLYERIRKTLSVPRLVSKDISKSLKQAIIQEVSRRQIESEADGSLTYGIRLLKSVQENGGFVIEKGTQPASSVDNDDQKNSETEIASPASSNNPSNYTLHRLFSGKSQQDSFLKKNPKLVVIGKNGLDFFREPHSFGIEPVSITGHPWFFEFDSRKPDQINTFTPKGLELAQIYSMVCGIQQAEKLPVSVKNVIISDLGVLRPIEKRRQEDREVDVTIELERDEYGEYRYQLFDKKRNKIGKPFEMVTPKQLQTIPYELGILYLFFASEKIDYR